MAGSFNRADKTSQEWVRADQTLLTAAILNLAINARNGMPSGGRSRFVASPCPYHAAARHALKSAILRPEQEFGLQQD
jgi:hypothetical protein